MTRINGINYDVTYVGDCEIREIAGSSLSVDAWGLDQSTRKYKGRLDRLPAFIATLRKDRFKPDPHYAALTLATYTANENGPWAEVDVTYKGTFDGNLPAPQPPAYGLSPETVTLSNYDGADSSLFPTCDFTYLAPTVTWRYVLRGLPTKPQTNGLMVGPRTVQIVSRRGGEGAFRIFDGGNLGDRIQVDPREVGLYNGVAVTCLKSFTATPAGIYYEVEEVNYRCIMPFELASVNYSLEL